MIPRLRDVLPFIKGWSAEVLERKNQEVTRSLKTFASVSGEKGWIVSAVFTTNNKYTTLEIVAGTRKFAMNPEWLYFARISNPLKPSNMPYLLRYAEDSPGSETGFFAVALDPEDWIPYMGDFTVRAQIPDKVILPDYTTVTPSATKAKIYELAVLKVKIVNEDDFFNGLSEIFWKIVSGKAKIFAAKLLEAVK